MLKKLLVLFLILLVSGYSISQDSTTVVNDSIYDIVDVDPEFPGGSSEMAAFIYENLQYPETHFYQNTIYIRFIVEKDGTLTNNEIIKGERTAYDDEAARLISIMPKWKPGLVNGEPVRVAFTIPMHVCQR
ncbi:MAG: energy transducer TonB [Crocinitomix sp.]|nr:energy transducer TonB [Crocinitomix sp.]